MITKLTGNQLKNITKEQLTEQFNQLCNAESSFTVIFGNFKNEKYPCDIMVKAAKPEHNMIISTSCGYKLGEIIGNKQSTAPDLSENKIYLALTTANIKRV